MRGGITRLSSTTLMACIARERGLGELIYMGEEKRGHLSFQILLVVRGLFFGR